MALILTASVPVVAPALADGGYYLKGTPAPGYGLGCPGCPGCPGTPNRSPGEPVCF